MKGFPLHLPPGLEFGPPELKSTSLTGSASVSAACTVHGQSCIFSVFPVLINRGQQELIHLSVACVNITQKKRKNTSKAFWAKGYIVAVK